MPSRGKKKTTMAKLNREARLRERRSAKAARKEARRLAAADPDHQLLTTEDGDLLSAENGDGAVGATLHDDREGASTEREEEAPIEEIDRSQQSG